MGLERVSRCFSLGSGDFRGAEVRMHFLLSIIQRARS